MNKIFLGDSSDSDFVRSLDLSPNVVYADTLFGTGKDRKVAGEVSYGDGKAKALDFTEGMLENMYEILPDDGTLWLHCNQDSDYIYRTYLNRIFGKSNFLTQIAWCYSSGGGSSRRPIMKHDTIFWFAKKSKSDYVYNPVKTAYNSLREGEVRKGFDPEGKDMTSFWTDIGIISTTGRERVNYATQKPLKLMNRIIEMSTNPGETIVDPCCGSGTTVYAALELGREGFGIDINPKAVEKSQNRINSAFGNSK